MEAIPVVPNTRLLAFLLSSAPADSRRDIYTVVAQPGRDHVSEHLICMTTSLLCLAER